MQEISNAELATLFKPVLLQHGVNPEDFSDEYITRAVAMVKSRINFVSELWDHARFFFIAPDSYDAKAVKKRWSAETPAIMTELVDVLEGLDDFSSAAAEPVVLAWIADKGYHLGNVMNAFRLAVVGECKGPHMFDITELMGCAETVRRIRIAAERIQIPECRHCTTPETHSTARPQKWLRCVRAKLHRC